jgi:hypothetical protein
MAQIKKYVGRISDDSLEEKLKPHLDRAADNLARRLRELVPRNRPGQANTLESSLVEADEIISDTCKEGADEVRREAESQPGTESALRLDAALSALGAIERTPFHARNSSLSEITQQLQQTKTSIIEGPREIIHEPLHPPAHEPRPLGRR